jgi:hypothetical protein
VIGSQAILGSYPDAPVECLISRGADVYPRNFPERSDAIDGAIGDGSPFERRFGYFAHGVGPETAVLPTGWESRLVELRNPNTAPGTGWCLEPHDLALAKYVAGRVKDRDFTRALARAGLLRQEVRWDRLPALPLDAARAGLVAGRIRADFGI